MRCLALLLLAVTAVAQPQGAGAIGGVVVDSATGDPVRKVVVTLTWHGSPRCFATAMTNSAGRFAFESLPSGDYTATARDNSSTGGAQSPSPAPDFITLAAGERKTDIRIALSRPASISGTVLDADGDPSPGVPVLLMIEMSGGAGHQLNVVSTARTNERGEYRFRKLGRGRYYVLTGGEQPRRMRFSGQSVDFPIRQFYGGASDWKRATPITVQPGEQVSGIDFRAMTALGVALEGTVGGLPAQVAENTLPGPNQRGLVIELSSVTDGRAAMGFYNLTTVAYGPDRRFQFEHVAPGRYRVTATYELEKILYVATQEVDLSADHREIALVMAPATDMKGRVKADAGVPLDAVRINLSRVSGPMNVASGKPAKDGTFVIPQVPPGQYMLRVDGLPKGAYERWMRVGGKEIGALQLLEIGTDDPGLVELGIGAKIPSLQGSIDDEAARRHPIAVLLVAADGRSGGESPRIVTTDKNGGWKVEAPPGKYKLIAYEPTHESSQLSGTDLAARLDRFSTLVELPEQGGRVDGKANVVRAAQVDEAVR